MTVRAGIFCFSLAITSEGLGLRVGSGIWFKWPVLLASILMEFKTARPVLGDVSDSTPGGSRQRKVNLR
jgi:hypothetical protein